MTRLDGLPVSLITDISREALENADHLPLLLVCEYFRGIVEDLVYREIRLAYLDIPDPCRRLHRFLRTLRSRPDLGARVRHLSIECGYDMFGLPVGQKATERDLVKAFRLGARWELGLDLDEPGFYAALIVILTPGLLSLNLQLRDSDQFTTEVLNPDFSPIISRDGGLDSLESLSYGPRILTGGSRLFFGEVHPVDISKIFYLPSLTRLSLTALGHGDFLWPTDGRPTSKLKHISIVGKSFGAEKLSGIFLRCPHLITATILVDTRGNSKYTVYGHIRRALLHLKPTIQEITLGFYKVDQGLLGDPQPQHPQIQDRIASLGSFAEFSQLERLTIPVVGYLGENPETAPALESGLPSGIKEIQIRDDTWIVDRGRVGVYWNKLLNMLHVLVLNKNKFVPDLKTVDIWLKGWLRDFDFNGLCRELRKRGSEVGVGVSVWKGKDD